MTQKKKIIPIEFFLNIKVSENKYKYNLGQL